ncbi:MAG TPA: GxxExxY protein [Ignavibacteria bacterium]
MEFDTLSNKVIGAAIEVHRHLGPGLLESAYEECLSFELNELRIKFERQKPLPVIYKTIKLEIGYRIDLLVENYIVAELKTVDKLNKVFEAQILSYMKFSGTKIGLLINFREVLLKDGIKRFVL